MIIQCVWEHNGNDTLLYAANLPGAYARGGSLDIALSKTQKEARCYLKWTKTNSQKCDEIRIIQEAPCELEIADADSDVLFDTEKAPLTLLEYQQLKALALKSAADFLTLYESIPNPDISSTPIRKTFYGQVPRTAREMYDHTKNVNAYYFGEINVAADNEGTILECRLRGFEALEQIPDFLSSKTVEGSYGESWNVRKMLRRFLWHDRIHAKAMYRMALREFGPNICNPFCFEENCPWKSENTQVLTNQKF